MRYFTAILFALMTILPTKIALAEGGYWDNYQIFKDVPKMNNWNDSMRRWSRGDGAWNNWRDWGSGSENPWQGTMDMMADMSAEAMGDAVAEVEFEFWLEVNVDMDMWVDMDYFAQNDLYSYWRNNFYNDKATGNYSSYEPEMHSIDNQNHAHPH